MSITRDDFKNFYQINKEGIDIFKVFMVAELLSNDDVSYLSDDTQLDIANIVYDCYLKDESNLQLYEIIEAVVENYKDIKEHTIGPRDILRKFIYYK